MEFVVNVAFKITQNYIKIKRGERKQWLFTGGLLSKKLTQMCLFSLFFLWKQTTEIKLGGVFVWKRELSAEVGEKKPSVWKHL